MENSDPTPIGSALAVAIARVPEPHPAPAASEPTEEQIAAWKRQRVEADWNRLCEKIGERYAECSFDNFQISPDSDVATKQKVIIERLRGHLNNPRKGRNVVFYGPKGSGKDHLMTAALRWVTERGVTVKWINGMDLFSALRDRMDSEHSEASFVKSLTSPALLAISDPLPPTGELTSYQRQMLFQVLDRRYRDMRPVWITANFNNGKEAEERMGPQLMDRLKDGALTLFCDWPSYRKPGA